MVDKIQSTGAMVHFLPPYSPDLNPIEVTFFKVKSILKANEDQWDNMDVQKAVLTAFNHVTVEDCRAWITH
jgi:transposase